MFSVESCLSIIFLGRIQLSQLITESGAGSLLLHRPEYVGEGTE